MQVIDTSNLVKMTVEIDGKDAEMKRQAQRFALPRENTAEDQAILDEFDDLFYNA